MRSSFASSRPPWLRRGFAALAFFTLSVVACGQVRTEENDDDPADVDSGRRPRRDAGDTPDPVRPDSGRLRDAGKDADPNDYEEPECPDPPPPQKQFECDPLQQVGCAPGDQCAPFVQYPGDTCEAEIYGALCVTAGTYTQGESCESQLDCAAGYICLITGAGTACGQSCDLAAPSGCDDGLVCVSTDVSGIGACN